MDPVRIHTYIDPERISKALTRGSVVGFFGIALLVAVAIEMPLGHLQVWGFPLLALGLLLIGAGLIPYKRLIQQRDHPNELTVTHEHLLYSRKGKPAMTIPLSAITGVSYVDHELDYGILVYLDKTPIPIHDHKYRPRRRDDAIFLPLFHRPAYHRLREGMSLAGY